MFIVDVLGSSNLQLITHDIRKPFPSQNIVIKL